jgi:LysM repeat protein
MTSRTVPLVDNSVVSLEETVSSPATGEDFFLGLAADGLDDLLDLYSFHDLHAAVGKILGLPDSKGAYERGLDYAGDAVIAHSKVGERKPSMPSPAKAVAVAAPKTTPAAPPVPKPNDAALNQIFLASKNTAPHTKANAEVQEKIPFYRSSQPIAAENISSQSLVKPAAAKTLRASVREYTLSSGDNLYAVSRRLLVTYSEPMEANGITDPHQLRIGQKNSKCQHATTIPPAPSNVPQPCRTRPSNPSISPV